MAVQRLHEALASPPTDDVTLPSVLAAVESKRGDLEAKVRLLSYHRLWAPWRLEYIKGPKPAECIFCSRPRLGDDAAARIVERGRRCFTMLNAYPYSNGHVMIAPYEHVPSIEDLEPEVLLELMTLASRSLSALREGYGPDGFNLGVNQGKIAGAGFEEHVHLHVVPRWAGDTNFMPVVGSTRVVSESLESSYEALRSALGELPRAAEAAGGATGGATPG